MIPALALIDAAGRGFQSITSHLNLSRFGSTEPFWVTETTRRVPQKVLTSSRKVDECAWASTPPLLTSTRSDVVGHLTHQTTQRIPKEMLMSSRKVDECKPLAAGAADRLDPGLGLLPATDAAMQHVLWHDYSVANQSTPGWFGPW